MKQLKTMMVIAATFLFASASAFAGTNDHGIRQRELNQQHRIGPGIQSGQLTPREAGRLGAQQARIHPANRRG